MSIEIGKYSKKKNTIDGSEMVTVTIPKARKVKGHAYPYKSTYLDNVFEDIQNDIRKELNISGHVKLVPTSSRSGRIVVV